MKATLPQTLTYSLGYLVLALACLIHWNGPAFGIRIDIFAGGYLALRLAGVLHSVISSLRVFRSSPLRTEWWALNSDPKGPQWVMLLMALDLTVFLDYGHWHLVPGLAHPSLQTVGLGLYLVVAVWQIWTDGYLASYFSADNNEPVPMNAGPYRYVRHPRYTAAIIGKVAMALALASILGWLLVAAWSVLLLRKIAVEENHLRDRFGPHYENYAQTTAKVIPGIY